MFRARHRFPFTLCLALLFIMQARLHAAPSPSTEAFLATLMEKPPCEASNNEKAPADVPLQAPAPTFRVIYPDCGVNCSDYQCQGSSANDSCLDDFDRPGRCVPKNLVCPNEPFHSPCKCVAW